MDRYRDAWKSYHVRTYTPGSGLGIWTWLQGILETDPKIAACANGDVYVAGKDSWNGVWTRRYSAGASAWQSWRFIGGIINGGPAIACGGDGAAYVAARGPEPNDKSMWLARVDREVSAQWNWAGGIFDTNASVHVVANGNLIHVLGLSSSAPWYRTWVVGSTWQGNWATPGGVLDHMSPSTYGGNLFLAGQSGDGEIWWWNGLTNAWTNFGNKNVAANSRFGSGR